VLLSMVATGYTEQLKCEISVKYTPAFEDSINCKTLINHFMSTKSGNYIVYLGYVRLGEMYQN
jgi:hypothetical protein